MTSASHLTRLRPLIERAARAGDIAALAEPAARVNLALHSGSDERLFLDPATGRTKYGTPQACAEDELWFSSSTATAVSARGYAAAADLWRALVSGKATLEEGFELIRDRLTQLFGIAGSQTILAGSGTEAVLVALAVVRMVCAPRLTIVIVGCAETGRGVAAAAAGLHFLRHAAFADVDAGARLKGLEGMDLQVDTIAIRDRFGAMRPSAEIDAELLKKTEAARRAERDVIIHRLEVSKTGRTAPSLATCAALCSADPLHVLVIADACQLRTPADQIKGLLRHGFLVSITGSKFTGGPPFAGALLVPPPIIERMRPMPLPAGFAAYSAQCDWPPALRAKLSTAFLCLANIGLGLRWQAALAEIERFLISSADQRDAIFALFHQEVVQCVARNPHLFLLEAPEAGENFGSTILCLGMRHADGRHFDGAEAAMVQRRLRESADQASRIHLGQPVAVGGIGFLRLSISAPLINFVADRLASGRSFAAAFAPVAEDLREVFAAWPVAMAKVREALERPL